MIQLIEIKKKYKNMKNKLNLNLKFNNYHQNSIELNSKINAKVHHNKMNKKSFSSIKKIQ